LVDHEGVEKLEVHHRFFHIPCVGRFVVVDVINKLLKLVDVVVDCGFLVHFEVRKIVGGADVFEVAVTSSCTSPNLRSSVSGRQRIIASRARSWSFFHFSTWCFNAPGIGRRNVPLWSRGVGSASVPSTMSKSLLYLNVAFVAISQTLYDSGLNSRRVIFLVVLSSAIVCLFVSLCFEPLF
jgi:hypothetical protein